MGGLFEITGLDLIPFVLWEPEDEVNPEVDEELISFREHKATMNSTHLGTVIEEVKKLQENDTKRENIIESKAVTLIGSVTLASTFVVGLSQPSINNAIYPTGIRTTILLIYIFIGLSLLMTITLALRATQVGKYKFMEPALSDLWKVEDGEKKEIDVLWSQAVTLFYTYIYNRELVNRKATHVSGAQIWFRNTLILLFSLAILLGIPSLLNSGEIPQNPVLVPVIVTATYTDTPSPTPTATATFTLTNTPTSTNTATATVAVTITSSPTAP